MGAKNQRSLISPTTIISCGAPQIRKILFCCIVAAVTTRRSCAFAPQRFFCQSLSFSNARKTTLLVPKMNSQSDNNEKGAVAVDPVQAAGLPHPLILGSASFTRKLILKEMGVKYDIVVRPIDEKGIGDRSKDKPSDLVLTLAKAKCSHLVSEIEKGNTEVDVARECIVLTGDQVVTHENEILEKPDDIDQAKDFVARYGRSPPSTVGSCVLTHIPSNIQVSGVDTATIHFKPTVAESNLIDRLIADGEPVMSCAGGLMVEHPFVKEHLDRIEGTEDSVMGLSKDLVLRLLEELSTELTKAGYKK